MDLTCDDVSTEFQNDPRSRRSSVTRPILPTFNMGDTPFKRVSAFFGMSKPASSKSTKTNNDQEQQQQQQQEPPTSRVSRPDVQCSVVVGGDDVVDLRDSTTEYYDGVDPHDLFPTEGDNQIAAFFHRRVRTFKNNVDTITTILTDTDQQDRTNSTKEMDDDDDDDRFY